MVRHMKCYPRAYTFTSCSEVTHIYKWDRMYEYVFQMAFDLKQLISHLLI